MILFIILEFSRSTIYIPPKQCIVMGNTIGSNPQKIARLAKFSNEQLLLEIERAKNKAIPNANYILGLKEEWLRREKKK